VQLTAVEASEEASQSMYSGFHRAGIVPWMHMLFLHPFHVISGPGPDDRDPCACPTSRISYSRRRQRLTVPSPESAPRSPHAPPHTSPAARSPASCTGARPASSWTRRRGGPAHVRARRRRTRAARRRRGAGRRGRRRGATALSPTREKAVTRGSSMNRHTPTLPAADDPLLVYRVLCHELPKHLRVRPARHRRFLLRRTRPLLVLREGHLPLRPPSNFAQCSIARAHNLDALARRRIRVREAVRDPRGVVRMRDVRETDTRDLVLPERSVLDLSEPWDVGRGHGREDEGRHGRRRNGPRSCDRDLAQSSTSIARFSAVWIEIVVDLQ
jgi:hypothetical protein